MRTLRTLSLVTLALALGGCPEDETRDSSTPATPVPLPEAPAVARCQVRTEHSSEILEPERPLALVIGSEGPAVFTNAHLWSGAQPSPFTVGEDSTVASTVGGYLIADARQISLVDATTHRRRTLQSLPRDAMGAQFVATDEGLFLFYRRVQHGAPRHEDDEPPGDLFMLRIDENGRAIGAPARVGNEDPGSSRIVWFNVRWDAGRLVIDSEDFDGALRYAVLSLDGRVLASGEGAGVVCPLAGCVRLVGRTDPGASDVGAITDGALHVQLLGYGTSFATPLPADHLDNVAVSGNRALVVVTATVNGAAQRSISILDILRRQPVTVRFEEAPVTTWYVPLTSTTLLRATRDGFEVAYSDPVTGLARQHIACEP